MMERNCYNCKYKVDAIRNPFAKALYYCKKQKAWIHKPLKTCPKFEIKLRSKIFGNQSPYIRTEPLVGGCEED